MDLSSNHQDVTVEECRKVVEETVSLISASGSIASGLVNAHVARGAIFMAYLTYVVGAASLVISVYNLMSTGNITLFIMAIVVLVVALIAIKIITQKFKDVVKETSTNYLGKAEGALFIIESLLNNRIEILKNCLNKCSGMFCKDIKELIKYHSGSTVSARAEQQS